MLVKNGVVFWYTLLPSILNSVHSNSFGIPLLLQTGQHDIEKYQASFMINYARTMQSEIPLLTIMYLRELLTFGKFSSGMLQIQFQALLPIPSRKLIHWAQ